MCGRYEHEGHRFLGSEHRHQPRRQLLRPARGGRARTHPRHQERQGRARVQFGVAGRRHPRDRRWRLGFRRHGGSFPRRRRGHRRARRRHCARLRAGQAARAAARAGESLRRRVDFALQDRSVHHFDRGQPRPAAQDRCRAARGRRRHAGRGQLNFRRYEQWFYSSRGSDIHQTKFTTGAGYAPTPSREPRSRSARIRTRSAGSIRTKDTN